MYTITNSPSSTPRPTPRQKTPPISENRSLTPETPSTNATANISPKLWTYLYLFLYRSVPHLQSDQWHHSCLRRTFISLRLSISEKYPTLRFHVTEVTLRGRKKTKHNNTRSLLLNIPERERVGRLKSDGMNDFIFIWPEWERLRKKKKKEGKYDTQVRRRGRHRKAEEKSRLIFLNISDCLFQTQNTKISRPFCFPKYRITLTTLQAWRGDTGLTRQFSVL